MSNAGSLAASIVAVRELAGQRAVLDWRESARGPVALAAELEALLEAGHAGAMRAREAAVGVASWIVHREQGAGVDPLRAAAEREGLPLAKVILARSSAIAALAPHGRLAEVSISARSSFGVPYDDTPSGRLKWYASGFGTQRRERLRMHHDSVMIGRLLDESWCRLADALVIASRRPTTPEIAFAVALRDRWFGRSRIREALAANPFSPAALVLALVPSTSAATLRVLARGRPSAIQRAARLFAG